MSQINPEDSKFKQLFVDVTQRCNMECSSCYSPDRNIPDLDVNVLYPIIEKLPHKTTIRLYGGEPTVRADLPQIITKLRKMGHHISLLTNGLKLARPGYAQELVDAGLNHFQISMNGGDDDEIYMKMDGVKCAARKLKGWELASKTRAILQVGAILQKGVNDHIPTEFRRLWGDIGGRVGFRFRNIMRAGRWAQDKDRNWTLDEMTKLVCDQFELDYTWGRGWSENWFNDHDMENERDHVHFPIDPNKQDGRANWIQITDWDPPDPSFRAVGNMRRGILTPSGKLEPFFSFLERTGQQFIPITKE